MGGWGAIEGLTHFFHLNEEFAPEKIKVHFRIHTTDFIELLMLPMMLKLSHNEAPGLKTIFQKVNLSLPKEELIEGRSDLAIAGFFGDLPGGFYKRKLFTDDFACCIRKGHPSAKGKISLNKFSELSHLIIAPGGELSGQVDKALSKKKLERNIIAGASGFLSSAWATANSDVVLTAPRRLIIECSKIMRLHLFEPPFDLPKINIYQIWHERQHRDSSHKWIREKIAENFR